MLLKDLNVALKVAEYQSITAAATSLGMQIATASAALKRVENALGVELFIRTTRKLRLSAAGEKYIPQCQQALQMLEQAKRNMINGLDIIEGDLRIALSSDLGRNLAIKWLDNFAIDNPKINLKVHISDSNIDFYRDSLDVALRYGVPDDSSLYGFKICNVPRLLCATPEYIKQNGAPKHPTELASHNGLFYEIDGVTHDVWTFCRGDEESKIKMTGNRTSNDGDIVRRWCLASKGVAVKSCLDMADDLLAGRVITIMPEFTPTSTELWLVCPTRQSIVPALRLLRDYSREKTVTILQQLIDLGALDQSVLEH